jgi:hypothetical protein
MIRYYSRNVSEDIFTVLSEFSSLYVNIGAMFVWKFPFCSTKDWLNCRIARPTLRVTFKPVQHHRTLETLHHA